jgi:hypothetical protein
MSRISRANVAQTTVEDLRRDIQETQSTIQRVEVALRKQMSAVRARGPIVLKIVADSHGKGRRKRGLNPAVRLSQECEAAIRSYRRHLAFLETELKAREAAAAPPKKFSWEQ